MPKTESPHEQIGADKQRHPVVLSDTKKFLFIHIPKTAGRSIQHVLQPYGVTDYFGYSRGLEKYIQARRQFPPHLSYIGAANLLTVDLSCFYKFTFVRNPWDRYVSMYEYFRKDTKHAMHLRCMTCSFDDFIEDVIARRATFDTKSQIEYVVPPAGMEPVNFIGKVENIENDFSIVCRTLDIECAVLPKLNSTDHKHYKSYYDDSLKRKVEVFCRPDIEMFGYTF